MDRQPAYSPFRAYGAKRFVFLLLSEGRSCLQFKQNTDVCGVEFRYYSGFSRNWSTFVMRLRILILRDGTYFIQQNSASFPIARGKFSRDKLRRSFQQVPRKFDGRVCCLIWSLLDSWGRFDDLSRLLCCLWLSFLDVEEEVICRGSSSAGLKGLSLSDSVF